jgi:cytochrome c oxidase cbb3-type subunit 3
LQGSNPKEPKATEPEAKPWVAEGAVKPATAPPMDSTKIQVVGTATK